MNCKPLSIDFLDVMLRSFKTRYGLFQKHYEATVSITESGLKSVLLAKTI